MASLHEPTALRLFLLTQHRAEVRWVYLVTTATVLLTILGDVGWVGSSPLYLRLPQLLLALTGICLSTRDIRWHRLAFDAGLFLFLTFDVLGNQRTSPDPDLGLVGCTLLPTMGGLEATRIARAEGITAPIIGVTASVLPEDLQAGADAGMDAHVSKPIDPLVLQRTLQRVLAPPTSAVG